jgi:hypothetical protein
MALGWRCVARRKTAVCFPVKSTRPSCFRVAGVVYQTRGRTNTGAVTTAGARTMTGCRTTTGSRTIAGFRTSMGARTATAGRTIAGPRSTTTGRAEAVEVDRKKAAPSIKDGTRRSWRFILHLLNLLGVMFFLVGDRVVDSSTSSSDERGLLGRLRGIAAADEDCWRRGKHNDVPLDWRMWHVTLITAPFGSATKNRRTPQGSSVSGYKIR